MRERREGEWSSQSIINKFQIQTHFHQRYSKIIHFEYTKNMHWIPGLDNLLVGAASRHRYLR